MNNRERIEKITELLSEAHKLALEFEFGFCGFGVTNVTDAVPDLHISDDIFNQCMSEKKREDFNLKNDKVIEEINGVEVFSLKPRMTKQNGSES